jgi:hypothetical protein
MPGASFQRFVFLQTANPSLALDTLSALLRIPLCIDFGITGAPCAKGVRKDEVGEWVIIKTKRRMRARAEQEILSRVHAIRLYLMDPDREKYISHEQIFHTYPAP